jgi:hypothetical protein
VGKRKNAVLSQIFLLAFSSHRARRNVKKTIHAVVNGVLQREQ